MLSSYKTRTGHKVALNRHHQWSRTEFVYLGTIDLGDGFVCGWAWHADGRSIDRDDRAFDLVDFDAVR